MNDVPRDEDIGKRLERHFDHARSLPVDLPSTVRHPARSDARSRLWFRGAAAAGIAAVIGASFIGADLIARLWEPGGELGGSPVAASFAPPSTSAVASPAPAHGCGTPEMPYADPNFTPIGTRFGPATVGPGAPPIRDMGQVIATVDGIPAGFAVPPRTPNGMSLQLIIHGFVSGTQSGDPTAPLQLFYSDEPVTGNFYDFLASGGVVVRQNPDHVWDAQSIARSFDDVGHAYSLLKLGPHEALAVLADPFFRDDLRPWHLYWHAGTMDWSIIGIADPIDIIEMGQSLYCP